MKTVQLPDARLMQMQQNMREAIDQSASSITNGRLISSVALSTSGTTVDHKLGRTPVGYIIVRSSANVTIKDTSIDDKQMVLVPSGTVTVSIWVF